MCLEYAFWHLAVTNNFSCKILYIDDFGKKFLQSANITDFNNSYFFRTGIRVGTVTFDNITSILVWCSIMYSKNRINSMLCFHRNNISLILDSWKTLFGVVIFKSSMTHLMLLKFCTVFLSILFGEYATLSSISISEKFIFLLKYTLCVILDEPVWWNEWRMSAFSRNFKTIIHTLWIFLVQLFILQWSWSMA